MTIGPLRRGRRPSLRPAGVADDLRDVGVREPFAPLSMFVAGGQSLSEYARGAKVHHDDRSELELAGPFPQHS